MTKRNFTLVGPHAGKTITLGNYKFVDGVFAFEGSDADVLILTRTLREQYQAFGPDEIEDAEKAYKEAQAEIALNVSIKPSIKNEFDIKREFVAKRMIAENLNPEDLYGKGTMADKVRADMDKLLDKEKEEKEEKEKIIEQIKKEKEPVKVVEPSKASEKDKSSATEPSKTQENGGNKTPVAATKINTIIEALKALDTSDDNAWTSRGIPSIDAVSKILGRAVSRVEIEAVAPNFTRSVAEAAKATIAK